MTLSWDTKSLSDIVISDIPEVPISSLQRMPIKYFVPYVISENTDLTWD